MSAHELPEGVRHYQTAGFATTEEIYAGLTEEAGWKAHDREQPDGHVTRWKDKQLEEGRLTVFAPIQMV